MAQIRFKAWFVIASIVMIASGSQLAFSNSTSTAQKKKAVAPVEPEIVPENYFPLSAGNYWLYRAKIEIGNDKGGTDKIDKPKRVQVMSANGEEKRRIIQ